MHTTLSASKQWAQRNQTAAFLLKTVIGANVVALLAQLAKLRAQCAPSCQTALDNFIGRAAE